MTHLKMKTIITNYVDYSDLEEFFSEKLEKNFEIIGSANDTDYSVNVVPFDENSPMAQWDKKNIDDVIKNGYIDLEYSSFHPFMSWACKQGWISEGMYVITISW